MTETEMVGWPHDSMDMSLTIVWEMVKDREGPGFPGVLWSIGSPRVRPD